MRKTLRLALVVLPCLLLCAARGEDRKFLDSFNLDEQNFVSTGKNTYFSIEPGYQLSYEGEEDGKKMVLVITVLNETKKVGNVETRVIEERETADGKPTEISRNYFAMDKTTKSIYYFGEDVDMYKDGKVTGHEGSWLTGVDGAKYGLMMPGTPKEGDSYYQEVAPGKALDRAEIQSLTEKVKTPAGKFENCLKTKETSGLDKKEKSTKCYAPGVGLVKDSEYKLTKYGQAR